MTRPRPNQAMSAALSGAVDLGALKARADAQRARAAQPDSAQSGTAQWVFEADETSFAAVLERSKDVPVVVALTATWSGEATALLPILERAAAAGGGAWLLAKVDLDLSPRIGQAFGVQAIPTVVAVVAGQPVDGFAGPIPENAFQQWINRQLDALRDKMPGIKAAEDNQVTENQPEDDIVDERFARAEEAVERGDFAQAEQAYAAILATEPANVDAKAALAQVRFSARTQQLSEESLTRADATPQDIPAQLEAADYLVANQRVPEGFQRLTDTIRRVSGAERDQVRAHLVGLFELFPNDDPRVLAARRNLASALY